MNKAVFLWTFVAKYAIVCPALGWAGQIFLSSISPHIT